MLNVDKMKQGIVGVLNRYKTDHIHKIVDLDNGSIKLETNSYKLDITINQKWVGFDFTVNKSLTEGVYIGASQDTDLYPLDHDEEVTHEIYLSTLNFLEDLLNNRLFYGKIDNKWVFARPSHKNDKQPIFGRDPYYQIDDYILTFTSRGLFGKGILATITKEGWSKEKVHDSNLQQLIANAP